MKKILFLLAYYYPEKVASEHLVNDLLESFVEKDFSVEIYAPIPTRNVDPDLEKEYSNKFLEEKYGGKLIIHRYKISKEPQNTIKRAIRYLYSGILLYRNACRCCDADVVFCNSTPPTMALVAGKIAKKKKIPFVYSLQDVFPDSMVNAGMTSKGSLIYKIGKLVERKSYKNADRIIVISERWRNALIERGVPSSKVVLVENWVDSSKVYPVSKSENPLFDKYDIPRNKFIVSYCGNIGLSQNLDLIINTAKKLEISNIEFVFVGEGVAKEEFQSKIEDNKLKNIRILPFQDYSEISNVYSIGDVGLVISKAGVGASSIPSKTWSIMAAARPVLASFDLNSDLADLIQFSGCGSVIAPADEEGFADAILNFANMDEASISKIGITGRDYVTNHLDRNKGTSAYIDTIYDVVGEKRGIEK